MSDNIVEDLSDVREDELFERMFDLMGQIEFRYCAAVLVRADHEHLKYKVREALNRLDFGNVAGARDLLEECLNSKKVESQEIE